MSKLHKLLSAAVFVLAAAVVLSLSGVGHQPAKAQQNQDQGNTPLAVLTAPQQPYTLSFYCSSDSGECSAMPKVPRGKRFVIEYVSARVLVQTGKQPTYLQIATWDASVPGDPVAALFGERSFGIPLTFAVNGSDGDYYSASEKVLIVAEPWTSSSDPTITMPRLSVVTFGGNKARLYGVLTGYLQRLQ